MHLWCQVEEEVQPPCTMYTVYVERLFGGHTAECYMQIVCESVKKRELKTRKYEESESAVHTDR